MQHCLLVVVFALVSALGLQVQAATPSGQQAFAEGFELLKAGRSEEAVVRFQAGLQNDPDNALAHFYLAEAYAGLKLSDKAQEHYQRSFILEPNGSKSAEARARWSQIENNLIMTAGATAAETKVDELVQSRRVTLAKLLGTWRFQGAMAYRTNLIKREIPFTGEIVVNPMRRNTKENSEIVDGQCTVRSSSEFQESDLKVYINSGGIQFSCPETRAVLFFDSSYWQWENDSKLRFEHKVRSSGKYVGTSYTYTGTLVRTLLAPSQSAASNSTTKAPLPAEISDAPVSDAREKMHQAIARREASQASCERNEESCLNICAIGTGIRATIAKSGNDAVAASNAQAACTESCYAKAQSCRERDRTCSVEVASYELQGDEIWAELSSGGECEEHECRGTVVLGRVFQVQTDTGPREQWAANSEQFVIEVGASSVVVHSEPLYGAPFPREGTSQIDAAVSACRVSTR